MLLLLSAIQLSLDLNSSSSIAHDPPPGVLKSEMEETAAFPPWLDLPVPLAELVLERLPLVDYIRVAAVCPKWRSIQRGHRLRHAPHPPPMAKQLPWLAPFCLYPHGELKVHSPSDRKFYILPKPSSLPEFRCLASCRGWLLLLEDDYGQPILFNPITAAQIPLPLLSVNPGFRIIGTMSAPPTDPNCIILLVLGSCAFLYRLNDHCATDWRIIQITPLRMLLGGSAIYCGGKFYYLDKWEDKLYVIDPFIQKAASQLVMRYPYRATTHDNWVSLHEVRGEMFSVLMFGSGTLLLYRVFKADLSRHEWVRVKTLDDHTLFHYGDCSVLVLAADVGCKKNSIYACKARDRKLGNKAFTWGAFDLGTGGWTEIDTLPHVYFGPWFLPALDSANLARAND